ncbi:hypothetical protein KUV85_14305 [Nocardioides panacisoli]|uniref:baeRF2 domain-containing protein n=1 Tax=Nocardioides panacisoli TaxID=627624 RepID=UPI001C633B60|nr:Vms1/Ankzf1 family peptidyl-tRNA hydrolase [Nocardioides panacisoli]QYJ03490.1 hypothetical protein KUV85_14305 [Nocardioides panacisoli]
MQLGDLRNVYDADGPFATVYLEGRSPAEDAEQQVRLRWDDLRGRLADDGADEATLEALDAAVLVEDITEVQTDGRVLVANASGVLLDEAWDAALGEGDAAHHGKDPELGAYVREVAGSTRLLVAIADQQGAVVRRIVAAPQHSLDDRRESEVEPASEESVHKPREGAFSHNQIQRRADEAVKQNVRKIAEHLDEAARAWRPDVVVLAGEVQGRTALRDELTPALQEIHREVEQGGTDDDAAEEALAEQLRLIAEEVSRAHAQEVAERFDHGRAHDQAAEGPAAVEQALEMGAVASVLLEHQRAADSEAHLLRAGARTDAEAALIDREVGGHVAALLRFEVPDLPRT